MITARTIIHTIGRKECLRRCGLSKQALTRPLNENALPAAWFDLIETMCDEAGIYCPRYLFKFLKPVEGSAEILPADTEYRQKSKKTTRYSGLSHD